MAQDKLTAEEIAEGNLEMGFDSVGAYGDGSLSDSLAAHMVNAIDTAREYKVSGDEVARIYMRGALRGYRKARKKNPAKPISRDQERADEHLFEAMRQFKEATGALGGKKTCREQVFRYIEATIAARLAVEFAELPARKGPPNKGSAVRSEAGDIEYRSIEALAQLCEGRKNNPSPEPKLKTKLLR